MSQEENVHFFQWEASEQMLKYNPKKFIYTSSLGQTASQIFTLDCSNDANSCKGELFDFR